ncbi:MAG TPA: hypothetical protein VKC62_04545 [Gaiellaceae bacterium]|nr:hypothetical protein [Gaiellaceae bacterium]
MRVSIRRMVVVLGVALVLAPAAHAGGPSLVIGATEDDVRQPTLAAAKANMDLIRLAGFDGVRITQTWAPGETALGTDDAATLANVTAAAKLDGIEVIASVLNANAKTAPLTDQEQADFAAYAASLVTTVPAIRHVIVGNEPNLNLYWLPQFDADGGDAAATSYESLLARAYDAIKAADPGVEVLGGAVSPHGNDKPDGLRLTHSPTTFIPDMGAAYRASGRATPIMDAFAFHPYEANSGIEPVKGLNPKSTSVAIADYGKLVSLLGQAFDGTAQPGSGLPIYYDEFGVQTQIPPEKAPLYTGDEPAQTNAVDEPTQAVYYREAVQLAFCEPTVRGLFLFHSVDETDLHAWQSGLYYPDGTAKASLPAVRLAFALARRGVVARCPGLALEPTATLTQTGRSLVVSCDIDCAYVAELWRLPGHLLATKRGRVIGGKPKALPLKAPTAAGRYRLRLSLRAPVNPGVGTLILRNLRRG